MSYQPIDYCPSCGSQDHKEPACPKLNQPTDLGRNLAWKDKRQMRRIAHA